MPEAKPNQAVRVTGGMGAVMEFDPPESSMSRLPTQVRGEAVAITELARQLHGSVSRWVSTANNLTANEILLLGRRTERFRMAARTASTRNAASLTLLTRQLEEAVPLDRCPADVRLLLGQLALEVIRLNIIVAAPRQRVEDERDDDDVEEAPSPQPGTLTLLFAGLLVISCGIVLMVAMLHSQ